MPVALLRQEGYPLPAPFQLPRLVLDAVETSEQGTDLQTQ